MAPQVQFEEKQFLGFNTYSIVRRMVLAIFCFVSFYYTENRMENAGVLFLTGIIILVGSIVLLFVKYLQIRITSDQLMLTGMWKSQQINIPFMDIVQVEKTIYSKYNMNNPAFNVHEENEVKFYTAGKDAIRVRLKNGSDLLIGTYRAEELSRALLSAVKK
ncbi:hypothetical protein BH11BAC2_BH11BAC2_01270 [soil metagenome]